MYPSDPCSCPPSFPSPAFSDEPRPSATPPRHPRLRPRRPEAKKAVKKTAPKPAAGSANLIVTKDAETGELRPATAAEREKLLGRQPLVAPEHKVVMLPDGSVMVELGEADMSYAVATKSPDGSLSHTLRPRSCGSREGRDSRRVARSAGTPAPAPKTDR